MKGTRFYASVLLALLALNTYSGVGRILGSYHGYHGAKALSRAEVDLALESMLTSVEWLPGEATYHVTIGRAIGMALANGLPLAALEGRSSIEILAVGAGATAWGIVLNPADAWGWFHLGTVYDDFGDARERLDRMVEAGRAAAGDDSTRDARPVEARDLDVEERIAAASAMLAGELEPEFYFYSDFLAALFWKNGLEDRAAAAIRESMSLMPRVVLHPLLEDADFVRSMAEPILQGIERAALNPNLDPSRAARARADILERLERHGEAIEAWEALSALGGEAHEGESDLAIGMIEQRRGRYEQSIPALERAVAAGVDRSGVAALYYLGIAHARLGDYESAAAYYRNYVDKHPSALGGYLGLAEALDRLGETEAAERIYVSAVRRFPENKTTYELTIRHMIRNGKEREAEPYAVALRKKDPKNKTALALLGKLEGKSPD